MSFVPYALPYPRTQQTDGIGQAGYTSNGSGTIVPPANPAAFAGFSMTVDAYSNGYETNSLTAYWWGQTEAGGYTSATQNFENIGGATTSFFIPFGCVLESIVVYSTLVSVPFAGQTSMTTLCGLGATWTGADGAQFSGACGETGGSGSNIDVYVTGTFTVQSLQGSILVPTSFFWTSYEGLLQGIGYVQGSLPVSVQYGTLTSTGLASLSGQTAAILATSDIVTNSASSTITQSLSAEYTVSTSQTVSDSNTEGATTSLVLGKNLSFGQSIAITESGQASPTTYTVTASLAAYKYLSSTATSSQTNTSTVSTPIPPGESVQLLVTGTPFSTPITFSATGSGTYIWEWFDYQAIIDTYPVTVIFSDYVTTLGITSSAAAVT